MEFINIETYDKYKEMMNHDFLWPDWEPSVDIVDGGIVIPADIYYDEHGSIRYRGGIINEQGTFVESSGLYKCIDLDNKKLPLSMTECPPVSAEDSIYIDEVVVYYGLFIYHWGHFLFESTNRLWYYIQEKCKVKGIRLVGVYINKKPDKNFQLFHEMLGIEPEDLIFIDKPTQFRRIIIPKASCMLSTAGIKNFYYSKEFLIPFDLIRDSVSAKNIEKIYLSRTKLTDNNTLGEKNIESNFRKNGFKIISPENETLPNLVSILKGAKVIAGLNGSNTHNLLFATSHGKAIILNRLQETNYPQELIHRARNIHATYVDVYSALLPVTHGNGPFLVSVNDNLFNYQITSGMLPYYFTPSINSDSLVHYLRLWCKKNTSSTYAMFALKHYIKAYNYDLEDLIKRFSLSLEKNEKKKHEAISRIKLSVFLWLHKHKIKNIYENINTDKSSMSDLNVIKYSYYFNGRWYKKKYMRKEENIEPAEHYLYTGFKDGNDPSPKFSTNGYLNQYPDICGINPLWHYEKHGKSEGRQVVKGI